MSNPSRMGREAQASLRLPTDLKEVVQDVAKAESRTLSSTMELLLRLGVASYNRDGVLLRKAAEEPDTPPPEEDIEELANRMADLVAERLLERLGTLEEEVLKNTELLKRGKNAA